MRTALPPAIIAVCLWLLALAPGVAASQNPPSVDEVFGFKVERAADQALRLDWSIAPGTYLYRDRINAKASGQPIPVSTGPGEKKDDPTFGSTEVYHGTAQALIAAKDVPSSGALSVTYQGCAEQGICYPPVTRTIELATLAMSPTGSLARSGPALPETWSAPALAAPVGVQPESSTPSASAVLSGGLVPMLAAFLGFGLLLSFTPCVFPMIPILSGILARSGERLSAGRGFALSGAYVLAAALAYAVLGVAAAWSGQNLQSALQTPLVLGLMSLAFVGFALSMFGLHELQLPSAWTNRASNVIPRKGGSVIAAAILGFGSALIVGPCVTPPLAAALIYVAQTGNLIRGATALFALGLGMGLPLLAFGTFGAGLLPRSGLWMVRVKQAFGVVFLGLAISMASRIIPEAAALALWAALAIGAGVFVGAFDALSETSGPMVRLRKTVGIAGVVYGATLLVGFAGGATDPLRPLAFLGARSGGGVSSSVEAKTVSSLEGFEAALAAAREPGKPIFVDFSAAWCVSCKEFDRTVLADPRVRDRLNATSIIRADVTVVDDGSRALMQRLSVIGPPTMLFIASRDGREIDGTRIVGSVSVEDFNRLLDRAGVRS